MAILLTIRKISGLHNFTITEASNTSMPKENGRLESKTNGDYLIITDPNGSNRLFSPNGYKYDEIAYYGYGAISPELFTSINQVTNRLEEEGWPGFDYSGSDLSGESIASDPPYDDNTLQIIVEDGKNKLYNPPNGVSDGVQSVTGSYVDDSDPQNPIVNAQTWDDTLGENNQTDKDAVWNKPTSSTTINGQQVDVLSNDGESGAFVHLSPTPSVGAFSGPSSVLVEGDQIRYDSVPDEETTYDYKIRFDNVDQVGGVLQVPNIDTDKTPVVKITIGATDYEAGTAGEVTLPSAGAGTTNLSYTPSPTNGIVNSDTGTDATLLLADTTNAGLLSPADKVKLNNTSNTNSGDDSPNTNANSYADGKVIDSIADGDTTHAPSRNSVYDALQGKENTITATTSADYYAGDKTFISFATSVLATLLTGISFVTGTAVVSTDSILVAFGKLQKQITDIITSVALKAPIASPAFTGTPTAPTPAANDYGVNIATTNYVDRKMSWVRIRSAYVWALAATTAQKMFNGGSSGNGSFSLLANSTYTFECYVNLSGLSSTSGTVTVNFGGTVGVGSFFYQGIGGKSATTAFYSVNTFSGIVISAASGSSMQRIWFKGTIETTTAGSFIPLVSASVLSATAQTDPGSEFIMIRQGLNTDTSSPDVT